MLFQIQAVFQGENALAKYDRIGLASDLSNYGYYNIGQQDGNHCLLW